MQFLPHGRRSIQWATRTRRRTPLLRGSRAHAAPRKISWASCCPRLSVLCFPFQRRHRHGEHVSAWWVHEGRHRQRRQDGQASDLPSNWARQRRSPQIDGDRGLCCGPGLIHSLLAMQPHSMRMSPRAPHSVFTASVPQAQTAVAVVQPPTLALVSWGNRVHAVGRAASKNLCRSCRRSSRKTSQFRGKTRPQTYPGPEVAENQALPGSLHFCRETPAAPCLAEHQDRGQYPSPARLQAFHGGRSRAAGSGAVRRTWRPIGGASDVAEALVESPAQREYNIEQRRPDSRPGSQERKSFSEAASRLRVVLASQVTRRLNGSRACHARINLGDAVQPRPVMNRQPAPTRAKPVPGRNDPQAERERGSMIAGDRFEHRTRHVHHHRVSYFAGRLKSWPAEGSGVSCSWPFLAGHAVEVDVLVPEPAGPSARRQTTRSRWCRRCTMKSAATCICSVRRGSHPDSEVNNDGTPPRAGCTEPTPRFGNAIFAWPCCCCFVPAEKWRPRYACSLGAKL